MLWNASAITGYSIEASDGALGSVSDMLFDDFSWNIRWLVIDTGNWLPGRKVLLPPSVFGGPNRDLRSLAASLTMSQVKDSPSIDTDLPMSRQMEARLYDHYNWDPYWNSGFFPMSDVMPAPLPEPFPPAGKKLSDPAGDGDPHLRSIAAVTGYHIHASDGEIGHAADFLVDDAGWSVRYLTVDTRNWWPGELVLVSPRSVRDIDWAERMINLRVTRQKVKDAPRYNASITVDGAYDEKFLTYYGIDWVSR